MAESLRVRAARCALLLSLGSLSIAGVATADPQGPAYLIEPGDAPANSVQFDPNAATDPNGATDPNAPAEDAPQDGSYDADAPTSDVPPAVDGTAATLPASTVADDDPRALDEFGPELEPYGTWSDDASYGTVWVPDAAFVGANFSPYLSGGHWTLDASGERSWASDYPFGGVVFHHGRWVWTARGWAWIPGYVYAPAWVAWRAPTDAYAYYGWAPLPPDFIWVNHGAATLSWRSSYFWVFCPSGFMMSAAPSQYVVRSTADARSLARHTRPYLGAVARRVPVHTMAPMATRLPYARPMSTRPAPALTVRLAPPSNSAVERAMARPMMYTAPHFVARPAARGGGPAPRAYTGASRGGGRGR